MVSNLQNLLQNVSRIERAVAAARDLQGGLRVLHEELSQLAPVDTFYVAFWDQAADMIFFPIYFDDGELTVYPFRDMRQVSTRLGAGFTSHIIATRKTLHIPDVFNIADPDIPNPTRLGGKPAITFLGVPLIVRDEIVGVISIQSYQPHAFSPDIIELVEQLSFQVAYVLENAHLVEDLRQQVIELETLRISASSIATSLDLESILKSILGELRRVVPYDWAMVQWFQDKQATVLAVNGDVPDHISVDLNLPIQGQSKLLDDVLETNETHFVNNQPLSGEQPSDDGAVMLFAQMAIPLIVKSKILGVLVLNKTYPFNDKRAFLEKHQALANVFAWQASIAINNAILFEEVQQLAIVDSLTGIFNRRHFFERAEHELDRARRNRNLFSIVMLDLDHFKRVNDQHGHLVGDQVLKTVAELCGENIRKFDLLGRYGGEEFVIFFPETNIDQAQARAESLRQILEQATIATDKGDLCITASFGVSAVSQDMLDAIVIDELLEKADQALYVAKQAGRNCVRVAS